MDDDAGAITAWYASAKPSFYPLAPGEPSQVVATLAITNARIDLAECRAVSIRLTGPMAARSITSNGTAVH
ncbi:hypothetical protein ASG67_12115 [Sphingomonas sp. Leaf339]|nr:hypothetical protein ASG67_12115 [Sphingomonas sp. Leaf339]